MQSAHINLVVLRGLVDIVKNKYKDFINFVLRFRKY